LTIGKGTFSELQRLLALGLLVSSELRVATPARHRSVEGKIGSAETSGSHDDEGELDATA